MYGLNVLVACSHFCNQQPSFILFIFHSVFLMASSDKACLNEVETSMLIFISRNIFCWSHLKANFVLCKLKLKVLKIQPCSYLFGAVDQFPQKFSREKERWVV